MTRYQISLIITDVEEMLDVKLGNYLADEADLANFTCTDCAFFTELGLCSLGDESASKYQTSCSQFYSFNSELGERIALSISTLNF